jgi:hypothetical protein
VKKLGPKRMCEVAHHEAGHAVAAAHAGDQIDKVWINSSDPHGEYGKLERPNPDASKDMTEEELRSRGNAELIICCAGPEAERRYNSARLQYPASDRARLDWLLNNTIGLSQSEKEELKRWAMRAAENLLLVNGAQ